MARAVQEPTATDEAQAADRPVRLRVMRAESVFRRETRNLPREERERFGNFLWNMVRLDMGPRVSLTDLVGPQQDADLAPASESALDASLDYYHHKDSADLVRVLKFYCAYLLQQARKESSFERQRFLLFKTIDLARTIVQHAEYAVDRDAEAIVFGILVDLGDQHRERFGAYMEHEQAVYNLVRRLALMPADPQLRLRLGDRLAAQTSFFDALVQYQALLRRYPPRQEGPQRLHGLVYQRMAQVFQNVAEHATPALQDGRKLKAFVARFNRDMAARGGELPATRDPLSPRYLARVRSALMAHANRWYEAAAGARGLEPLRRVRLTAAWARNLIELGRHRDAQRRLEAAAGQWARLPLGRPLLEEHADYLRLLTAAAQHGGDRSAFDRAMRTLGEVQGRLGELDKEERDRRQRRAALLG